MNNLTNFIEILSNTAKQYITEADIDIVLPDDIVDFYEIPAVIKKFGPKDIDSPYYFTTAVIKKYTDVEDVKINIFDKLIEIFDLCEINYIRSLENLPSFWNKKYVFNNLATEFIIYYLENKGTNMEDLVNTYISLSGFRNTKGICESIRSKVVFNPFDEIAAKYWGYSEPSNENLLISPKKYKYNTGDRVICKDLEEFRANFEQFTFGLFSKSVNKEMTEPFNWEGLVISGGSIEVCLRAPYKNNIFSDVDIFLFGQAENQKIKLLYLLKWFYCPEVIYTRFGSIFELYFNNISRKIQIITTGYLFSRQVIDNFDFSYIQWMYDGKNVTGTPASFKAIKTMTAELTNYLTGSKLYRSCKAIEKGYSVVLPNEEIIRKTKSEKLISVAEKYVKYYKGETLTKEELDIVSKLRSKLVTFYYPSITLTYGGNDEMVDIEIRKIRGCSDLFITRTLEGVFANIKDYSIQFIKNGELPSEYKGGSKLDLMEISNDNLIISITRDQVFLRGTGKKLSVVLSPEHTTCIEYVMDNKWLKFNLTKVAAEKINFVVNTVMSKCNKQHTKNKVKCEAIKDTVISMILKGIIVSKDGEIISELPVPPFNCKVNFSISIHYRNSNITFICNRIVIDKDAAEIEDELTPEQIEGNNEPTLPIKADEWIKGW